MPEGNEEPTRDGTGDSSRKSLHTSRRRWLTLAGGTIVGGAVGATAGAAGSAEYPNTISIDGTVTRGKSTYEFGVSGSIVPADEGRAVENNDNVGESSVSGAVHRDEDVYWFSGTLTHLDVTGDADVSVGYGDEGDVESSRLEVVAAAGESIGYMFTVSDRVVKVTDIGAYSADDDDAVVENDDGSWTVKAVTADGSGDTWDFWGDVTSFDPMEDEFTLFLDGEEVTTYDLTGETPPTDREHTYSFEGTGDSWADYYLEVEDGGDMIAATVDGAVVEDDFHWISDDGTKAAGRVDPGERHAYAFDNLVLDVTIDGTADPYVDGSPSNLSLYPQDGATGDSWKGGFPWQDDGGGDDSGSTVAIGGGADYGNILTEADADVVVTTVSGIENALEFASRGDVVFVDGSVELDVTDMHVDLPAGVTLASDRGLNGSSGATLYNTSITDHNINAYGGRITGLDIRGAYPGDDTTTDWGDQGIAAYGPVEIDNCEARGFSTAAIQCRGQDGGTAHVHHCFVHNNNGDSRGYGVAILGNFDRDGGVVTVDHCFFENDRHSVTTDGGPGTGFICEYNHFSPITWRWPSDAHQSDENDGYGSDLLVVRNCIFEATRERFGGGSDVQAHAARGPARDSADIYDNWFFHSSESEAISYSSGAEDSYSVYDNSYGENANVSYSDVIPGYDGWRT